MFAHQLLLGLNRLTDFEAICVDARVLHLRFQALFLLCISLHLSDEGYRTDEN